MVDLRRRRRGRPSRSRDRCGVPVRSRFSTPRSIRGAARAADLRLRSMSRRAVAGIVNVRGAHAASPTVAAESPMESEARLVFIDGGLPLPELQYEIVDQCGRALAG